MPSILPVEPLPATGMSLKVPRVTTGPTTAVQATENTAASETDLVEELGTNPITTITGQGDMSQQLVDRSEPGMADVVLARELGASLAASLDLQILQGSGTSGQMLGLTAVTGIGSTSYADATPTQQESFTTLLKAASDQAVALGRAGDAILLHPRRRIWFSNWRDSATGAPAINPLAGAGSRRRGYPRHSRRGDRGLRPDPHDRGAAAVPRPGHLQGDPRARQRDADGQGHRPPIRVGALHPPA